MVPVAAPLLVDAEACTSTCMIGCEKPPCSSTHSVAAHVWNNPNKLGPAHKLGVRNHATPAHERHGTAADAFMGTNACSCCSRLLDQAIPNTCQTVGQSFIKPATLSKTTLSLWAAQLTRLLCSTLSTLRLCKIWRAKPPWCKTTLPSKAVKAHHSCSSRLQAS